MKTKLHIINEDGKLGCLDGDCVNGPGKLSGKEYDYIGTFKNKKFVKGSYVKYTDITKTIGLYIFNGTFKDQKYDDGNLDIKKNGKRSKYFIGKFQDNKIQGNGSLEVFDDSGENSLYKYVGNFSEGKFSGQGTLTFSDGRTYTGTFNDTKFTSSDGTFETDDIINYTTNAQEITKNCLKGGCENDEGIYKGPLGYYEGEFKNYLFNSESAKLNTTANYTTNNSLTKNFHDPKFEYIGSFVDGKIQGNGKIVFTDKSVYEGKFQDSTILGKGKFTFPNGSLFDGYFETIGVSESKPTYTFKYEDGEINNIVKYVKENPVRRIVADFDENEDESGGETFKQTNLKFLFSESTESKSIEGFDLQTNKPLTKTIKIILQNKTFSNIKFKEKSKTGTLVIPDVRFGLYDIKINVPGYGSYKNTFRVNKNDQEITFLLKRKMPEMKNPLKLTESNTLENIIRKTINEKVNSKKLLMEKTVELIVKGEGNDPYEYKKDGEKYYTRKKGATSWILLTKQSQIDAVKPKFEKSSPAVSDITKNGETTKFPCILKVPNITCNNDLCKTPNYVYTFQNGKAILKVQNWEKITPSEDGYQKENKVPSSREYFCNGDKIMVKLNVNNEENSFELDPIKNEYVGLPDMVVNPELFVDPQDSKIEIPIEDKGKEKNKFLQNIGSKAKNIGGKIASKFDGDSEFIDKLKGVPSNVAQGVKTSVDKMLVKQRSIKQCENKIIEFYNMYSGLLSGTLTMNDVDIKNTESIKQEVTSCATKFSKNLNKNAKERLKRLINIGPGPLQQYFDLNLNLMENSNIYNKPDDMSISNSINKVLKEQSEIKKSSLVEKQIIENRLNFVLNSKTNKKQKLFNEAKELINKGYEKKIVKETVKSYLK